MIPFLHLFIGDDTFCEAVGNGPVFILDEICPCVTIRAEHPFASKKTKFSVGTIPLCSNVTITFSHFQIGRDLEEGETCADGGSYLHLRAGETRKLLCGSQMPEEISEITYDRILFILKTKYFGDKSDGFEAMICGPECLPAPR